MNLQTYHQILRTCFPNLKVSSIRFLGGGTHRVFEVNHDLIFKFPHGFKGDVLLHEVQLCRILKNQITSPIPEYIYQSDGCAQFPYPVAGFRKLPGIVLEQCALKFRHLKRLAPQIGAFLTELHRIPQSPELKKHTSVFHFENYNFFLADFYAKMQKVAFPCIDSSLQQWTRSLFEEFMADENAYRFEPVLTHGDFDSSNVLIDPDTNNITGIIDFEETNYGDPAWDFTCLRGEFGKDFLDLILRNYHLYTDDNFRKRVVFHAKRIPFYELLYGIEFHNDTFKDNAIKRLRRAQAGEDIIGGWLSQSTSATHIAPGFPE